MIVQSAVFRWTTTVKLTFFEKANNGSFMKLLIPLKDIMLAPGKRFEPASCSENDIIERVKQVYGVISDAMEIEILKAGRRL